MSDVIEAGNEVKVSFSTHPPIIGVVTHTPRATGDSWRITTGSGDVVYIQQFDFIVKLSKKKTMTSEETKTIETINQMTQREMATLWKYAPANHPYFDKTKPYFAVFDKRFTDLEILKSID